MTTDPVQQPDPTETFEEHRSTLIGAAYRILGSRVEAEDVVQEAWIRWSGVDHDTIDRAARLPAHDHHAARTQPAAHAGHATGELRRAVAARARRQ